MEYTEKSLMTILDAFFYKSKPSIQNGFDIYGCLVVSNVEDDYRYKFGLEELEDTLHFDVGPGLLRTVEALRYDNEDSEEISFYPEDVIDNHLETEDFAGATFSNDEYVDEYMLETSINYLCKTLLNEGIYGREVYIFRYTYSDKTSSVWDMHSMNLTDATLFFMESNNIPITTRYVR